MRFLPMLILALTLAGCGGAGAQAGALPSHTPSPTATLTATATFTSTVTPTASATPTATATITPTATAPAVLLRVEPPIQHAQVARYQQRLITLGYREVGAASGVYDAQTEAAVQHFEWLNGLAVDGAIDEDTAARLESPDALAFRLPPPFAGRNLRRGMYVHALENPLLARLTALGYLPAGRADAQGKFTAEDEAALHDFQRANRLPASGVLDLASWEQAFSPRAIKGDGWMANGGPPDEARDGSFPPGWHSAIVPLAEGSGDPPLLVTLVGEQVWLARRDGALLWFDPLNALLHGPIYLGDLNLQDSPIRPLGMAAIGQVLWVYSAGPEGQVLQGFDTRSGLARPPLLLADCAGSANCQPARAFGFDGRRLWLGGPGASLRAVNPLNGTTILQRALSASPEGLLAFDGRCLWASLQNGMLAAVDPGQGTCSAAALAARLPVGLPSASLFAAPQLQVAPGPGQVWLSALGSARIERFDVATAQPLAGLDFGSKVTMLTAAGGQVWVGEASGRLTPLDAFSAAPGQPLELGCAPLALAADGPDLWAACADATLRWVMPGQD